VKFLLDECLPHRFVQRLAARGYPDAVHPIHIGLRGVRDDIILARAIADDRIIITTNASDYRRLLGSEVIHPGGVLLPNSERERYWHLLLLVLAFLELQDKPADYMVNRLIEVSAAEGLAVYDWPEVVEQPGKQINPMRIDTLQ
jgi:Domain of unknown function (DUF5615)